MRRAIKHAKKIGKPIKCLRGKPRQKLNQPSKSKRVAFAKGRVKQSWKAVMFTDRCRFEFSNPGTKVAPYEWVLEGEETFSL